MPDPQSQGRSAPAVALCGRRALRRAAALAFGLSVVAILAGNSRAGDILRGGMAAGSSAQRSQSSSQATAASAAKARTNASDALARTAKAVQSVQAMQQAARSAASSGSNNLGVNPNDTSKILPDVADGLATNGLEIDSGVATGTATWSGADKPTQWNSGGATNVNIKQTQQQALLSWKTFNVGRNTTVTFDQSAGDTDSGDWIAFNKITDPSGNPSQILGSIKAEGQVYVINPNGIIFGGSSQINVRTLVASSLPINDNLVSQGLLNNKDAQFLFSGLYVPGGSDGTTEFTPAAASTASGHYGDVSVQAGAQLTATASAGGNGGRIMLVGANVTNAGTLSAESGQVIVAAGLQVGVASHDSNDPSLRGLDVWVGSVGDYGGSATNTGSIEVNTGGATVVGKTISQQGSITSTTSVSLNGRIDIKASYGAVANPNYDNLTLVGGGGPEFFNQSTGTVEFGSGSVTRILPDYASTATVPGTSLAESSQINVEGYVIHFASNAMMLAPNADVSIRAGVWPYADSDGDRTVFDASGNVSGGLNSYYSGATQKFFFSGGQIYLSNSALISVAGSTDVSVPLSQSILTVELRGSELADSPLQRNTSIRGIGLTVDIRKTGTYNGKFWMGTPLGDVTGAVDLLERNVSQLTVAGGNITMQSGGSIAVNSGATLDVSGGYYTHEGGYYKTTWLLYKGQIVPIEDASPNRVYDGVYTGKYTETHSRWGVSTDYATPLIGGTRYEASYVEGADGGDLSLTAPSMALDGELRGLTVEGPRQREDPADYSSLSITFEGEKLYKVSDTDIRFFTYSPEAPEVTFTYDTAQAAVPEFKLVDGVPQDLPQERIDSVKLSPDLLEENGFGKLTVRNPDGDITVPSNIALETKALGEITFTAANITILGDVSAPGGSLSFTTYNTSPIDVTEFPLLYPSGALVPEANTDRGMFTLGAGVTLDAAGLIADDRRGSPTMLETPKVTKGGSVSISSYSADLAAGSVIDVSGGLYASPTGTITYGDGGSISILTGTDPAWSKVTGGSITLGSELRGYSGAKGGSLTLQASLIQVGGAATYANTLVLDPRFFSTGGFTSFSLTGIGAGLDEDGDGINETYVPAINIAAGTVIEPVAESLLAVPNQWGESGLVMQTILKAEGVRSAVSLSFTALGSDDPFTIDELETRGDIVMGEGARIETDPGASVSFKGQTVSIEGSVVAPGGTISVRGASSFPMGSDKLESATFALPTVYLGPSAVLSAAGVVQYTPDAFGRRLGTIYGGGKITVYGNIVAESGALLDVSGTSGTLDLHPSYLGEVESTIVPVNSGINSPLWSRRSVATVVDSSAGTIDLEGSQMLFSDATLLGKAGGATATGGTLSIFSGRFYSKKDSRTSADINLEVGQSGATIPSGNTNLGIGLPVLDENGDAYTGMGYFSVDTFTAGGFASLDLGAKYLTDATPISYGGNVKFNGPVTINASGSVRVAAGGVIEADDQVTINASYIAVGQPFRAAVNANDNVVYFKQDPAPVSQIYTFAPTWGTGNLELKADLIDIGTLSLMNIGSASFSSTGDIRGNGVLSMAGDLVLTAKQIYPTTLGTFDIFVYDHGGTQGSVTILSNGSAASPLSAGGSLGIYASDIVQAGNLKAPLGSITLGWDGYDTDPSDADIDGPVNPVVGTTLAVPVTSRVTLASGSLTTVSGTDLSTGEELVIPYGLSPDGLSWIDPSGLDVTISGLPEKEVVVSGGSVSMQSGSTVDISGGGDLLAYKWSSGTGGSIDLLGTAETEWGSGVEYVAGDLVTYRGETWSARLSHSGQKPSVSRYWSKVSDSYAIIPDYGSTFAPYSPFNSGSNANALGGDPGYVSSSLKLGDTIYLEGSATLAAGSYTLLPRRYALLDGAYLVTPTKSKPIGTYENADGSSYVSGYTYNVFNEAEEQATIRTRYEVASPTVIDSRASYDVYSANTFMRDAADRNSATSWQRLPQDSGYALFQATSTMDLSGSLRASASGSGRGAKVDISSFADIELIGGSATATPGTGVVLYTAVLNSWGVDSLLVGGTRHDSASGSSIEVRTSNLTLSNAGADFSAPEIVLLSKASLTLTAGSSVSSSGAMSEDSVAMTVNGDGTLLMVSGDSGASVSRSGLTGSTTPLLTIGAGVSIAGTGVILDSTYASNVDADTSITADALKLAGGQISVLFDGATLDPANSAISPHLTLSGTLLSSVQSVDSLTLQSYRTIDLYGTGSFGSSGLQELNLLSGGLRGYQQGSGTVNLSAGSVLFDNPTSAIGLTAPGASSGTLAVNAGTITLGANSFAVSGYQDLSFSATSGILGTGTGTFSTTGNLHATAPVITGSRGSSHKVEAGGAILLDGSGTAGVSGGLGASFDFTGASIVANTSVLLPSGELKMRATSGDVRVGGILSVAGTSQDFYDVTRYADAGSITLESATKNVALEAGSSISVAAASGGGNAGTLEIKASGGSFSSGGVLYGQGGTGGDSASFKLDAGSVADFNGLNATLDAGGILESRDFRVRSGDVTITGTTRAKEYILSLDNGSITISGTIDASGQTGGTIALSARKDLILHSTGVLTVAAKEFNSAGKGGEIRLEAGASSNGVANTAALLDLRAGSKIDLSVAEYVAGNDTTVGSSAFYGDFQGTLSLRAPRLGNDVRVNSLGSTILGASSVQVEAYKVYTPAGGVMNTSLRDTMNTDNAAFITAGGAAIHTKLLTGAVNPSALDAVLVLSPGVEIVNTTGDLVLGLANPTGSTNAEALSSADWDLSSYRYGTNSAPGVLTLRAKGDIVFNNTLSDGFTPVPVADYTGHSTMWLATLMTINPNLPVNTQSWSYHITAGADLSAANSASVLDASVLTTGKGSVLVGEFYPAVPNTITSGSAAAVGTNGQTADTIRISSTAANRGTRFEVVRTGTGSIDVAAGRDVQLRNQFATIYTAGVAVPEPTRVITSGDFVLPNLATQEETHPRQGNLGAVQQFYGSQWSMAGGNVNISAANNIGRYTMYKGQLTVDSSRQTPTDWLYRRSYVDASTGKFASDGGVNDSVTANITDTSTSTTWWVDFSNFFEGVGALGGGNVSLTAGNDVVNVDAVTPTNARMAGVDTATGNNLAPDAANLLELGGGDVTVRAGNDISGGVYYVERGNGTLYAGGSITTNSARSPSLGILATGSAQVQDSATWLPTTLFLGNSSFDVAARGDVLLGPATNVFLMPQGVNNKFWYKTYFNTFSDDASVNVTSLGGDVTHRSAVTLGGSSVPISILSAWYGSQNLYAGATSTGKASYYQPWNRLAELDISSFGELFDLTVPTLRSTSFAGNINLEGDLTLFPSASGGLELLAAGSILGLQETGRGKTNGVDVDVWTYSTVNVSDTNPSNIPSVVSPVAYQSAAGRSLTAARASNIDVLATAKKSLRETGSYSGAAAAIDSKQALHDGSVLHKGDTSPLRLYAVGGDITGLTLFSPKVSRVYAGNDITDVSFYLQNISATDISVVSAGRDIIPFNESATFRSIAGNLALGNSIGDTPKATASGGATNAMAGDFQMNGPGTLEVLAGRNLDLGTGSNFKDGTGVGINSIGNNRNPFLSAEGADLIVLAGVSAISGSGPALALSASSLDFDTFISDNLDGGPTGTSAYMEKLGVSDWDLLTGEQKAIVALEEFYRVLRDTGRDYSATGSYDAGYAAIDTLFGASSGTGEIFTRSRDIRTTSGGAISIGVPGGGVTMASSVFGNPLTPPGIVTEYGGSVSIFTDGSVDIGQARIFTLRGGDIVMWSSNGDIAAGTSPKTVVTAPPTRVLVDVTSANIATDLGGLATGGGIGVLAAVEGVDPGNVDLIAPKGVVDAGDAGIRVTGNLNISATAVLNASNIQVAGSAAGVPSAPTVAAPNIAGLSAASSAAGAATTAAAAATKSETEEEKDKDKEETPSIIVVEVLGYGGGE